MRKFTFWLSALMLVFGLNLATAQTKVISGKVTDASGPLPGVSVVIKGTTKGTQTDFDGKYSIQANVGDVLQYTFVGMETASSTVGASNVINVTLKESAMALEEVIVVAYGTAKKADFTGSATKISAETMSNKPVTNLSRVIEGNSAGVMVTSGSGQPGAGQDIRIRGFGSVNASSSPLYVVDGAPYSGEISAINMGDVENVTILKDAASTSLYGSRAANGVIMITTKKGKQGSTQNSLTITQGVANRAIPEYERLNAFEYYPIAWESYRNSLQYRTSAPLYTLSQANIKASADIKGLLGYNPFNVANDQIVFTDGTLNPAASLIYGDDLDWFKYLEQTGQRSSYDFTFSGGNDKTDYYASMGYLKEEGFTIESDYQRYTGRININNQATNWFKTGLNLAGTITKSAQAEGADGGNSYVNPFFFPRSIGPIYPVYVHDPITGLYKYDENGKIYDFGNMTQLGSPTRPAGAHSGRHIIAETLWNDRIARTNVLNAKAFGEIKFLNDFKFTTNVSIESRNYNYERFDNRFVGDGAPAGRGGRTNSVTRTINVNQLLNYNKSFGDHNVAALIGHENYQRKYNYLYGFRQGLVLDGNSELVNFTTTNSLTSFKDISTNEGYFGRLDYNFNSKYYLSASYRQDASSKFYEDVRWGDFWSVGLSWRIDQENFMKDSKWINQLKLRSTYGEVGNDLGIDIYAYQAKYDLGRNNGPAAGYLQSTLANNDLTWESNNSFDVALEFGIKHRIEGSIEFYHRVSDNLLFDVPLPLSSGVGSITKNAGSMYNEGFELTLSADVIKKENFKWNVNLNATTIKNQFTKLPGDKINEDGTKYYEEIITGTKKLKTGHSIYDYWLRDWRGVDPADGLNLYKFDKTKTFGANERIINGDTLTISPSNALFHYTGSAIPDVMGGITNTFSYKNFTLSTLLTYQIGGKAYDGTYASLMHAGTSYGAAWHKDILNRWQKPGDITNVPRVDVDKSTNIAAATSDRWLTSASYFNIKSISLSYNLPKNLASNWGIKSAKIYISGENLYLNTSRTGLDVQRSFAGTTDNTYTPSRIISSGLNLTF